ncbi:MAG: hypothetical protein A2521_10135 [Deltaproteobacteria bacterium RIFOXYD12_FULL_57_12]|nr:MAG: hypothetical protein A2521_10135 [Deltaproteobacteria bacterium RIFOXYD12_FULL_57_12]
MKEIRDAVLHCLEKNGNEEQLVKELDKIIAKSGESVYSVILHVFTHLSLEQKEAKTYWHQIIAQWHDLGRILGRQVSLRTAICDYFCSVQKSLKNPKVVEIQVFEKTIRDSRHDDLTGLLNRKFFDETLTREVALAKRHGMDLSLLFLDLDNFKEVNDTYGHKTGDMVLREVAKIIKKELRGEDIACRYGGEELVIVFPQISREDALFVGERIRTSVERKKIAHKGGEFSITVSGGLVSFPVDSEEAAGLLACADNAMYRAKGSGKNKISFCSSDKRRYLRLNVEKEIRVKELGVNGSPIETSISKDISVGGLLFEYSSPLEIGTQIQLEIPLKAKKPLFVIGRVVRVECINQHRYDIGITISFLKMDKAAKQEISSYLHEQLAHAAI